MMKKVSVLMALVLVLQGWPWPVFSEGQGERPAEEQRAGNGTGGGGAGAGGGRPSPAPSLAVGPELTTPPPQTRRELSPSRLPDYQRQMFLSLSQAQAIALQNNPEMENARRDTRLAELEIERARATYDPYFQADASYSKSQRPTSQSIFGRSSETSSLNFSTGVTTVTGGSLSLDFRNTRQESDSALSTLNPSYNTDLSLSVKQPLLKNRYNDARAMDLKQRENDLERSRLAQEAKRLEIEAQTEEAYWNLYRAFLDLEVKRQALELAERMDKITKAQVQAGTAAAVAVYQTEAALASASSALIQAENNYRKSQANFKMLLNLAAPDFWSLEIIPTDRPRYEPVSFDREAFLGEAMANNFTLRQMRLSLANAQISREQALNRTQPQLDFRASVGVSGLAGTDHPSDQTIQTGFVVPNPLPPDQFPQPYIMETRVVPGQPSDYAGHYPDAFNNMMSGDNLSWSAGVTFYMPIGNRAARADYERARLNYEKMQADLRYQERQVYLNLVNLLYDLDAAYRGLLAGQEARRLQEKNRETEEKKYSLGLNTGYEVQEAQKNYEEARNAEIGTLVEYNKVKGRIERARQGFLGGGTLSLPAGITPAVSLPSGVSGGSAASLLQQYQGLLPAGMDINSIRQFLP